MRAKRSQAVALSLLLLALGASQARAADGCSVDVKGTSGSIACSGDVPETTASGDTWERALEPLLNATDVTLSFNNIAFTDGSFRRMLTLVAAAGAPNTTGTVAVELDKCSMKGQQLDVALSQQLGGSTQYTFTLKSCSFVGNGLNMTALLAAQDSLDVTLRLLGSEVKDNVLMTFSAAAVGATGKAAITLAESSTVSGNQAFLFGALAVAGDGELSIQLASSEVKSNVVTQKGLVALGGNGTLAVSGADDAGVTLEGNTLDSSVMVVQEQPLVATAMDIILGIGFAEPGFDLEASLGQLQGQMCGLVSSLNVTQLAGSLPEGAQGVVGELAPALMKIVGLMCNGSQPASDFSLASLAPAVQGALMGGPDGPGGLPASLATLLQGLLGPMDDQALQASLTGLLEGNAEGEAAVNSLLQALLTSPAGDSVAGAFADVLGKLGDFLNSPIVAGSGNSSSSDGTSGSEGGQDLGGAIADIISAGGDAVGGALGDAGGAVGDAADSVGQLVQSLIDSLTGSGSGGDDGSEGATMPGDILSQLVTSLTGGEDSPLAGVDLTGLLPIVQAVVADPEARGALPGLLQGLLGGGGGGGDGSGGDGSGSGGLDLGSLNLGPIMNAILSNPDAAAALPNLLGLLGNLGIQM